MYVGAKVTIEYHKPIKVSEYKFDELFELTEQTVKNSITA